MFGFMIWLVIGGVVGWIASVFKRVARQQDVLANIVSGIVGAYAGGALLAPFAHITPPATYLVALVCALSVIAAYDLVNRARLR